MNNIENFTQRLGHYCEIHDCDECKIRKYCDATKSIEPNEEIMEAIEEIEREYKKASEELRNEYAYEILEEISYVSHLDSKKPEEQQIYEMLDSLWKRERFREACHNAIRAIEKRTPKKVVRHEKFLRCPNCNIKISIDKLKYCMECGQALDWSV